MRAVIMAGGEGTRLRPLSLGRPKPMTPLFDRPILEHSIALLKKHGITDLCITLRYMPQSVIDYFGDGKEFGVSITYFVEEEPLGTAGSVKRCMEKLGDEDFLVISGDAVCDLDLGAAEAFHKERRPAATLVLYRHPKPLEYGLVLTDEEGNIRRFVEKPSWGQVVADTVNTGIYFLSRRAMDEVPEGVPYDFGGELFPRLLAEGVPLCGYVAGGYWCDVGDPAAYLECAADALSGKVKLDLGLPVYSTGIWTADPIPEGVTLVPPCWIGRSVSLGAGALIGPHAVLGSGSSVGKGSLVQRSVLLRAGVGERATLYGAILCPNASARRGSVLNEGTVLGEESVVEENAALAEGVKLWPGRHAPQGSKLTASLTGKGWVQPPVFGEDGVMRGTINEEICPQLLLMLGGALGTEEKVGIGWTGGRGAAMLSRAAVSGVNAAGAQVIAHDGSTAGMAAWFAARQEIPVSLFLEQEGEMVYLSLFDKRGLSLPRSRRRKLEGAVMRSEVARVAGSRVGRLEPVTGVPAGYVSDAGRKVLLRNMSLLPMTISVLGDTPSDRTLTTLLETMGITVKKRKMPGTAAFSTARGGRTLMAWDENGAPVAPETLLTLVCLIELEYGGGQIALPSWAPMAADALAEAWGRKILRLGADGAAADELYAKTSWLWDGVMAAGRICARMGILGEPLRALISKLPHFSLRRREVPLQSSRGEVMRQLAGDRSAQIQGEGLRFAEGSGWVYLTPLARRAALKVISEGADAELAAELCDVYVRKVSELDKKSQKEK